MSNLNFIQLINSFSNIVSRNISMQGSLQNQQSNMHQNEQQLKMQNILPQTTMQLNETTKELASLSEQQTINMIKDLLNLPRNFENLLARLVTEPYNQQNTNNILRLLYSNIDFSKLTDLIKTNSKEAMSNLYQILAQYNQLGVSLKEEQMNQISKILSAISSSAISDVQSFKTIMLMYLPWLPLTDPNAFRIEISNNTQEDFMEIDDSVEILFTTQNYGNLKCGIYKAEETEIIIAFISSETFPHNDFINIIKEESKKYSISLNFESEKRKSFNKKTNEDIKPQICMNITKNVNPFLTLFAITVIKAVNILDNKEDLRVLRKEKFGNGQN